MGTISPNDTDEKLVANLGTLSMSNDSTSQSVERSSSPDLGSKISVTASEDHITQTIHSTTLQRTALLPVHRLPPESLGSILILCIRISLYSIRNAPTPLSMATRLKSVCTRWRDVAVKTPSLWTILDAADSTPAIVQALQLSGELPLYLTSQYGNCEANADGRQPCDEHIVAKHDRLFTLCIPAIPRWRTVDLHLHSLSTLESLSNHSAEALEELKLIFHNSSAVRQDIAPIDLFKGEAPRLKDVTISFPVNWGSSMLLGLRRLCLIGIPPIGPFIQQFRAMLESSPELQELTMKAYRFSTVPYQVEDNLIVKLPLLTTLDLELPPYDMEAVLTIVQAPNLISFRASVALWRGSFERVLEATKPFLGAYCDVFAGKEGGFWVDVSVDRCEVNLETYQSFNVEDAEEEIRTFSLSMDSGQAVTAMSWMMSNGVSALSEQWDSKLVIEGFGGNIHEILAVVPQIQSIEVWIQNSSDELLTYLATPVTPEGPWPLTNLHSIKLKGGYCMAEQLLQMVEQRYLEREGVKLPEPLEYFCLDNVDGVGSDAREQIREIVGDVFFHSVDWGVHDSILPATQTETNSQAADE